MHIHAKVIAMIMLMSAIVASMSCASEIGTLHATVQSDGWSAQPITINQRYTNDATRDHASGVPIGDDGYYLHILTSANYWDYSDAVTFVYSFVKHPWGHTWLILEGPRSRLECGHSGNYGVLRPRYHDGVIQKIKDKEPNPIAYLWETMLDGQFEIGNPGYDPTYVWRMPITGRAHHRIHEYVMKREYRKFNLTTYNCGELVTQAAMLAGINLSSQMRITFPDQGDIQGHHLRVWTNPKYGTFELRSMDVLELELRHLARLGIGEDGTAKYRHAKPYQQLKRLDHPQQNALPE